MRGYVDGHFGTNKTLAKVIKRFYWIHIRRDVEEFCRDSGTCDSCSSMQGGVEVFEPFPMTHSGNALVMVTGDRILHQVKSGRWLRR